MQLLRLGNSIFDTIISFFAMIRALSIFDENTLENMDPFVFCFLSMLLIYLYYFVFETLWQRTPAKFITGTKVITSTGDKPTAEMIASRTLIRFIHFEAFSFLGERVHGWHDRWSNTYVIKGKRFESKKNDVQNQTPNPNVTKEVTTVDGDIPDITEDAIIQVADRNEEGEKGDSD